MLVFTTVEAVPINRNMAKWLQQAQQRTGIMNLTITQENEACNDHQTTNSGDKKAQSTTHHILLIVA